MLFSHLNSDIQIGFDRNLNTYYEPLLIDAVISNVTIRKAAGQTSEQRFRIDITASAIPIVPGVITPATLQSADPTVKYDYSLGYSEPVITRDIFPNQEYVTLAVVMTADELPEGLEGFQLTLSVAGSDLDFPSFQLPGASSTAIFTSSRNQIIDSDRKTVLFWFLGALLIV